MAASDEQEPVWRSQAVPIVFFLIIALLVVWAGILILAPFLTSILLAVIVVTLTWPFYQKLLRKLNGRENLAASLMLLFVTVGVFLPLFFFILMLIEQANALFEAIRGTDFNQMFQALRIEERVTVIQGYVPWLDLREIDLGGFIVQTVEQVPAWVATYGGSFVASLTNVVIGFIFMLLAAFYFYTEGDSMIEELRILSPLPNEYEDAILETFRGVIDATFRGQVLTALFQGFILMVGLLIVGVPGAVFWGAVGIIFALIPMVGAAAVWVPATIYLFFQWGTGDLPLWRPVVLAIWGAVPVSLGDNLIRPWAMRRGTKMSAILLFFSIIGGLRAFGFVGLILGPLVFALFVTIVQMYKYFFARPPDEPEDEILQKNAVEEEALAVEDETIDEGPDPTPIPQG